MTVRHHPTLSAMWCLGDDIPEVSTGDDHTKVHVYGAVALLTGRTHYGLRPTLSQEEFARFLRQLARYFPRKHVLIIHDRAEQHRGQAIDKVAQETQGRLMLMPTNRFEALDPGKPLTRYHHPF